MTNAELAILSLIAEYPRHGYEIEKTIEARGMRDWTEIGFSSIYYLLNKLEKSDLIESRLEQVEGKGPARKVYQITSSGRQAHVEGTFTALSTPRGGTVPFLLGLSNLPTLSQEQIHLAMQNYQLQLEEQQQQITRKSEAQSSLPFFVQAMFDYGLKMIEAEMEWIHNFRSSLEVKENVES